MGAANELNQITPGLGHAMHLVSEAYTEAGTKAAGGAVGVAEFNTALSEAITSMGPLIIAMLGIEAAMKLWDATSQTNRAVDTLRLQGRAQRATFAETHAGTLQDAQTALAHGQSVNRELAAAVRQAHASHNENETFLLKMYEEVSAENVRLSRKIASGAFQGR